MRTKRINWGSHVVMFFTIIVSLSTSGMSAETDRARADKVSVIPVVQHVAGENTTLRVAFKNTTQEPLGYFGGLGLHFDRKSPGQLELSLYVDGKPIPRVETNGRFHAIAENVYVLKPGETVDAQYVLPGHYGMLKPGRYEVRIKYHVEKEAHYVKEFGITPLQFEQTILYFDVLPAKKS